MRIGESAALPESSLDNRLMDSGWLVILAAIIVAFVVQSAFGPRAKPGDCHTCRGLGWYSGPGASDFERVTCWKCRGSGKRR
ncbi:hypothetical protein ACFPM3_18380 [Streptomyces coeruleoprunus]|uniref:Uncharacterized protein n=1 Tax=Streptomyces coeruleoprunus TaxID=285563 RepID=A0ABV9XIB2_9ACTN